MINGVVVGLVLDNVDPDGMHRVKVKYPVDADSPPQTSWARMMTPMSGKMRGLVMLPDVGTEVVLGFSYRTMSPIVMGAVYNGAADQPKPYANEDKNDDHRRFWSRNSHWIDIDDTSGDEHIRLTSTTENEAIVQDLDSAKKTITEKVKKDIVHEAAETMSFKCKDFKLEAEATIDISAGTTGVFEAGQSATWQSGTNQTYQATRVDVNGGSPAASKSPIAIPAHKHPPTKP